MPRTRLTRAQILERVGTLKHAADVTERRVVTLKTQISSTDWNEEPVETLQDRLEQLEAGLKDIR